jgi:small subunit ribosomal protein S3
LGVIKTWDSRWYAGKGFPQLLEEDIRIRDFLKERLYHAGVSKIEIERAADKAKKAKINRRELQKKTQKEMIINIKEIKKAEMDAQLIAENVALQLERRVSFRRAMKRAVTSALKMGAKGIRIACAGRLGGAEMARREWYREGRVPLHTLRADIDYGLAEAKTTYGVIGVKVWIFRGEIFGAGEEEPAA